MTESKTELRFAPPNLRAIDAVQADVAIAFVFEDAWPLRGLAGLLDWRTAGKLSMLAKKDLFKGEAGESLLVPGRARSLCDKIVLLGAGLCAELDDTAFGRELDRTIDTLSGLRIRRALVELPGRGHAKIEPERAGEIVSTRVAKMTEDAWWLVEDEDSKRRMIAAMDRTKRRRVG